MKTSRSYPNFSDYRSPQPIDITKWMNAMRDVYVKVHLGNSKIASIDMVSKDWSINEKNDFVNWMKYYESGDYLKYKKAQAQVGPAYYVNDNNNYFLPNPKFVAPSPIKSMDNQISDIPEEAENVVEHKSSDLVKQEKRQLIENYRRKLLGRLNSAEKLLGSDHGQMFAGPDFEKLLSSIYDLKKQIQTINKMEVSAQTIVDLIVRQAGILKRAKCYDASSFMIKLAQDAPGAMQTPIGDLPAGGSAPDGLGSLTNNTPDIMGDKNAPDAVGEFLENLDDGGITDFDDVKNEPGDDNLSFDKDGDSVEIGDDVDFDMVDDDGDLVVEAQAVPGDDFGGVKEMPPKADKKLINPVVKEDLKKDFGEVGKTIDSDKNVNDIDIILDKALSGVTIQTAIDKLEEINNIFKNREIPRQLALVDMILSRLGIAQYFNDLSEVINKNLDCVQYSSTRMETIISDLRSSSVSTKIDLEGKSKNVPPQAQAIKANLEQAEQKEKQRKETRKALEEKSDEEKLKNDQKPDIEVEDVPAELGSQPVKLERPAAKPPVKPLI